MLCCLLFLFQAEDGIRDLVRSRGLGDVYKRQTVSNGSINATASGSTGFNYSINSGAFQASGNFTNLAAGSYTCLLYTSDAADERSSVDLGGRRNIKKKKHNKQHRRHKHMNTINTQLTS